MMLLNGTSLFSSRYILWVYDVFLPPPQLALYITIYWDVRRPMDILAACCAWHRRRHYLMHWHSWFMV